MGRNGSDKGNWIFNLNDSSCLWTLKSLTIDITSKNTELFCFKLNFENFDLLVFCADENDEEEKALSLAEISIMRKVIHKGLVENKEQHLVENTKIC